MSDELTRMRAGFARRVGEARRASYGDDVAALAAALGLPERTWRNYEAGVTMPAEVLLRFLALTGVDPRWLLIGRGRPRGDVGAN